MFGKVIAESTIAQGKVIKTYSLSLGYNTHFYVLLP